MPWMLPLASLEEKGRQGKERRRQPTYWIDRGLRAVLSFPAYLISLVFGCDRRNLPEGAGRALWILSILADVSGIYGLGIALEWW
jgi:hypothetical protein